MVYIADEGGKQRGADVGSKEVLMVYMRRLEHVAGELYSSPKVESQGTAVSAAHLGPSC